MFKAYNYLYRGRYSINASAGESRINLSPDNGEVLTLINPDSAFTAEQLGAGYLSEAQVDLRLFNAVALPATFEEGIPIVAGRTGNVTILDGALSFELRSNSELLGKPVTNKTSPKCPYIFGGSECGLNLQANNLQFLGATVTAVAGTFNSEVTLDVVVNSNFVNGTVFIQSGNNRGLYFDIQTVTGTDTVTLVGEFAGTFEIGDTLDITAYCQKDQAACIAYSNFENFGGVPVGGNWVPGLTRITVVN